VFVAALIFFTSSETFGLFPSTCTDLFGTRYATANASLLYTAKGTSAWLVPLANVLKTEPAVGTPCSSSQRQATPWSCWPRC